MNNWKIYPLYYGKLECPKDLFTPGIDVGLMFWIPYLGFLLDNGQKKLLVDAGINERMVHDGKAAFGGFLAEGSSKHVSDSLQKIGVKPDDIDMVLYTHLHNDHAGACHLFPNSVHVFHEDEWANILDPLPAQRVRTEYDMEIVPVLKEMNCLKISENIEIEPGIKLYKTPGHTAGSMSITVETGKGLYVLCGDTALLKLSIFTQMDKMVLMDGSELKVTPASGFYKFAIPSGITYDFYAWYRSIALLKALVKDPKYLLTGHDPSQLNKVFPE
ncbi:MAG: N-acyl homoserine lactonase family protein [Dehalococcoidia bacterium]|nr:N-acyl homoserine lactonase family protein [Dehalococcoidia bacterium]